MEITDLKKIGKSVKYKVFVDNLFWCILIDETIVKFNLKKGVNYDADFLNNAKAEGQKKLALNTAMKLVSLYSKTKKEIGDYLNKKSFSQEAVKYAIKKLQEYNYINDENYAKNYINMKKSVKGKKAIEFELKNKGINLDIIKKSINEMENQDEEIFKLAEKFLRNKKDKSGNIKNQEVESLNNAKQQQNNEFILKGKLFNHLMGKGFEYDEIMRVINKIFEK
ncbi:MAG: RecX family transcriptional regulator [Clostridia bacterium]|nr:RecX family transcriptional regulator [Clostridia bacterium]MDD3232208.1 RecX family transcriptional regulator [Clostridia bacterium]MDD3862594.1 RecX family transcriptional regulator [Clostridia bacterium]